MNKKNITVAYIDKMGDDLTVVNAARVSFDKRSYELSSKDIKLIDYLAAHGHWSPFSHCFVQFRIEAPMFVARQLAKHQVGLTWNEVSRRYVDTSPDFFVPEMWRGRAANNKQGSTGAISQQEQATTLLEEAHGKSLDAYHEMLELGVAPEMARMVLPQTTMTEWYWSGSLYALQECASRGWTSTHKQKHRMLQHGLTPTAANYSPVSWEALTQNIGEFDENQKTDITA